jgi:hypothetical protein
MSEPRFVQIATAVSQSDDGSMAERLYALDTQGHLWLFVVDDLLLYEGVWRRVSSVRKAGA